MKKVMAGILATCMTFSTLASPVFAKEADIMLVSSTKKEEAESMKEALLLVKNKIDIHLVTLAINPYDKDLNTIFFDYGYDKNNYSFRYFEDAIILLNQKGPVGIAHPARYISNYNIPNYKIYIIYLYQKYKYLTKNGFSFTEAYYQSYSNEKKEIIEFIKLVCDKFNINKSGSIDNHGKNFFKKL